MQYGYRHPDFGRQALKRYAIVSFLPDYIESLVRPIREQFDPDYSIIPPNLVLVAPFETELTLDEISEIVGRETQATEVPTAELQGVGDDYPRYPLIFWKVKPNPTIQGMHRNLYTSLELAIPYRQFSPHITVAREISQHRVMMVKEKIYPYLPDESFPIQTVDLVAPVAGERWVSVRTFQLRAGA
jgi:2'-5' RNA ligase